MSSFIHVVFFHELPYGRPVEMGNLPDARARRHLDLEMGRSLLDKSRAATLRSCDGQGEHFRIDHCEACFYLIADIG